MDRHEVTIDQHGLKLAGDLSLPAQPAGLVLFAHGSGSSRFSTRNRAVAQHLNDIGLATLLLDLLTADEEVIDARTAELRFDILLLAQRLTGTVDWTDRQQAWPRCRWACSAPAPAPPSGRSGWPPWCRAADGRIWRCRRWSGCARRRC